LGESSFRPNLSGTYPESFRKGFHVFDVISKLTADRGILWMSSWAKNPATD